jgi:hypothetical protein
MHHELINFLSAFIQKNNLKIIDQRRAFIVLLCVEFRREPRQDYKQFISKGD